MRKLFSVILSAAFCALLFTGCTQSANVNAASNSGAFDSKKSISVVSREEGSGTRGAFIELFGVEIKNADGTKSDKTTKEAIITSATNVMMTNIGNDPYAIGYISLGSLNSTVKALEIDGVKASKDNVKNGSYKISRPFIIATKGDATGLAKDFIDFIMSKEGQTVVGGSYITIDDNAPAYTGTKPSGKITVSGSSSVSPIMEKLKEAYEKINTGAVIELQTSDSTTGMNDAMQGKSDIGMSSRELKESESAVLKDTTIALDGIAVIVNNQNPMTNIASSKVKDIFTGTVTKWSDVQ